MTGAIRPQLRLVPHEPDQVMRLARFRQEHPDVNIREGTGYWQSCIPEPSGETVTTRYLLRELLDKLDALFSDRAEISGQGDT
jgi:hypothetical protein